MRMLRHRRPGVTLIELLVVIAIILLLTAITVIALPSAQDRNMQAGVDRLQGWLLIGKQRAKRDGLPTGLRIIPDPNNANQALQFVYIQQPDDYALPGSSCIVTGNTVTFTSGATALVDLNAAGVQAGDYLEFYRGGGVYQIASVASSTSVTLAVAPTTFTGTNNTTGSTTEYRIRRQPVPISGEEALQLPDGVAVDLTTLSKNIPVRTVGAVSSFEIVFSPQGGMVGRGGGSDQICILWMLNTTNTGIQPLLVAVQVHTGFIGVQVVNTDPALGDAYANCRTGRSSGL